MDKTDPFAAGESLISLADERKRERILTRDEERKLLESLLGPPSPGTPETDLDLCARYGHETRRNPFAALA